MKILTLAASAWIATAIGGCGSTTTQGGQTGSFMVTNVTASGITDTAAAITWTTNVGSSSQVEYGTSTAYGSMTSLDATPVTSHSVAISGLTAGNTYHFRVHSRPSSGSDIASGDFTFATQTNPPSVIISNVSASAVTSTTAIITWTTDLAASSRVEYGVTTAYGLSSQLDSSLVQAHSTVLANLQAGTLYHFRVHSQPSSAGDTASADFSFSTQSGVVTGLPPGYGWKVLPNTSMVGVSPGTIQSGMFNDNTFTTSAPDLFNGAILPMWTGGTSDDVNHRMIIFGGGHADYQGNEVYVLNLAGATPAWARFVDSTTPVPPFTDAVDWEGLKPYFMSAVDTTSTNPGGCGMSGGCVQYCSQFPSRCTYQSGAAPSSRHTAGGLVFHPGQNRFYSFGGSLSNLGNGSNEIWSLDMSTRQWTLHQPYHWVSSGGYGTVAYNSANQHILGTFGDSALYDFDFNANTKTTLNANIDANAPFSIQCCESTAAVDTVHNYVIFAGGDKTTGWWPQVPTRSIVRIFDLSGSDNYATHTWDDPSCSPIYAAPGMAWDPVIQLMVIYPGGGNQLLLLNPGPAPIISAVGTVPSHKCLSVALGATKGTDYPSDPDLSGATLTNNGTYGRFAYFPSLDVFVLVNSATNNAWVLRLPPNP